MEFLFEYGLFLAKAVTVVVAIAIVLMLLVGLSQRGKLQERGHIEVRSINDTVRNITHTLQQVVLPAESQKQLAKNEKKQQKQEQKSRKQEAKQGDRARDRLFVVDFEGDVEASAVTSLREEVTAILSVAEPGDEVVIRLESPGGLVHGYGLAASQLQRIRARHISLTVAVDKVAASGGYMMACIANRIIAAPFAVLGSIGVVAQLPNFHRLLKKNDIDVEILTAGEHKRTLTMFGENTEAGREKFLADLEDVHTLFKDFVSDHRPQVNLEEVATGEAWYGTRALGHQLVDDLMTSDEYIVAQCEAKDVFQVRYVENQNKVDKLLDRFTGMLRLWRRDPLSQSPDQRHHFTY